MSEEVREFVLDNWGELARQGWKNIQGTIHALEQQPERFRDMQRAVLGMNAKPEEDRADKSTAKPSTQLHSYAQAEILRLAKLGHSLDEVRARTRDTCMAICGHDSSSQGWADMTLLRYSEGILGEEKPDPVEELAGSWSWGES